MKKIVTALSLMILGMSQNQTYADIGIVNEITYTNHSFTLTGNDATFPISGEADITLTIQNANTSVPANAVWIYLKFPCQQFWRPQRVLSIPSGFVLLDSLVSGNETILKFGNNVALPAPASAPELYQFVVRGIAVASSESYSSDGSFQGNFANMEYADGIVLPGTVITQSALQGINKSASVTGTPLPVGLADFSVYKDQNTSLLKWNTVSESNNKGFDVEHSADGKNFTTIGFQKSLAPNGNSSVKLNYSFIDTKPLSGDNYYRLRQIDNDGSFTYSNVRKVNFGQIEEVKVYPNPVQNRLLIEARDITKISVYNVLGQEVTAQVQYRNGTYEINTSTLPSGSYTIHLSDGVSLSNHKIIVKH